jgi:hypothetical protein
MHAREAKSGRQASKRSPMTTAINWRWAMESRVDLLAAVMYGHSREEAEKLVDDFVHDLAEKQRREMRAPGGSYDASRWNRCVGMTADAIDPAVSDG